MAEDIEDHLIEAAPEETGKIRRSYSQLSSYARCSELFRLERIVRPRIPDRPAAWLALGIAVHAAYENWERSDRSTDAVADFEAEFERIKAELLAKQPDLNMWIKPFRVKHIQEHLESNRAKGAAQMESLIAFATDPDNEWMVSRDELAQARVELPLDFEVGNVRVVGYVDVVPMDLDGSLYVVDLKTGNRQESNLQLGVYKVGLKKQYNLDVAGGFFLYSKDMKRGKFVNLDRYTEGYLADLFESLERGIENQVFIPNPSDFCGICPASQWCREMGSTPIPLDHTSVEPFWASAIEPGE